MAAVAAVSVAVATWCAMAAGAGGGSLALVLVGVALAVAAGRAATRRSTAVLPPGKDVVVLTAVTVAGFVVLYLAGWTSLDHRAEIARVGLLAVVGLSTLWPEPNVLRYCLLVAGGTLLAGAGGPAPPRAAVGGALVAIAVALVATNRLSAASGPRLGSPARASRRRLAGEAAAVLALVGLLAALAASLLPPPPGAGGGSGSGDRRSRAGPAGPPVQFGDRLDVGAGRGERDDDVVLSIRAAGPDLWRATTYDHWDGESWTRSADGSQEGGVAAGRVTSGGIGDAPRDPGAEGFVQSVTVRARSASVFVAAARPVEVARRLGTVREGADGTLYPTPPLVLGESYVVVSDRSRPGAGALRGLGDITASVPPDVAGAYLPLPTLSPRVTALAATIAGRATTTYDAVRALEHWLLENTTVTDDATPVASGTDPLESFLLEERSGPPERTATSLAVMLRSLGIPARIAVGFLPGTRSGPGREFVVRSSDTHAWVEVWFPGAGWQRFDPTGKAPPPAPETESVWDRLRRFLGRLLILVLLVALVAGAWLAWRGARWWRERAARPWATRFFGRLERAGSARGRPRQPHQTPAEYAGDLARTVLPDPRLEEVGALVTVAAYSRHEPAPEERARAEAVLRQAARAAPVRRGLMAALRRRRRLTRSRPAARPTIRRP